MSKWEACRRCNRDKKPPSPLLYTFSSVKCPKCDGLGWVAVPTPEHFHRGTYMGPNRPNMFGGIQG